MPDLFDVIVDGVAARDEDVDAVGDAAKEVSAKKVAASNDVVLAVITEALRATALNLQRIAKTASERAKREAEEIRAQDPLKVRAVKSVDVAERRTARAAELAKEKEEQANGAVDG